MKKILKNILSLSLAVSILFSIAPLAYAMENNEFKTLLSELNKDVDDGKYQGCIDAIGIMDKSLLNQGQLIAINRLEAKAANELLECKAPGDLSKNTPTGYSYASYALTGVIVFMIAAPIIWQVYILITELTAVPPQAHPPVRVQAPPVRVQAPQVVLDPPPVVLDPPAEVGLPEPGPDFLPPLDGGEHIGFWEFWRTFEKCVPGINQVQAKNRVRTWLQGWNENSDMREFLKREHDKKEYSDGMHTNNEAFLKKLFRAMNWEWDNVDENEI